MRSQKRVTILELACILFIAAILGALAITNAGCSMMAGLGRDLASAAEGIAGQSASSAEAIREKAAASAE